MTDHPHQQVPASPVDTAEHWDERYGAGAMWSGKVNQALVAEVATLAPGTAVDVCCGEGGDALWLAGQGWRTTAVDISRVAIGRLDAAATAAGLHVDAIAAPFLDAPLETTFDLVVAMYPVLLRTDDQVAEHRLLDLVAPGGQLLFVHHLVDHDTAQEHGFDPSRFVSPADILAAVAGDDAWEVVTDEQRERHVTTGAGAGHSQDLVVRIRRR